MDLFEVLFVVCKREKSCFWYVNWFFFLLLTLCCVPFLWLAAVCCKVFVGGSRHHKYRQCSERDFISDWKIHSIRIICQRIRGVCQLFIEISRLFYSGLYSEFQPSDWNFNSMLSTRTSSIDWTFDDNFPWKKLRLKTVLAKFKIIVGHTSIHCSQSIVGYIWKEHFTKAPTKLHPNIKHFSTHNITKSTRDT